MIDASRGVLDKACEMCEQPTPHLLLQHEYWADSTGTGQRKGGLAIISKFMIGSNHTKFVIFGNGNLKPSMGAHGGKLGTLNKIELVYSDGRKYLAVTIQVAGAEPILELDINPLIVYK